MRTATELVRYTFQNDGPMRVWREKQYKRMEDLLKRWLDLYNISGKDDEELVFDMASFDFDGLSVLQTYMASLEKCREQYSFDTTIVAVDAVLQQLAETLSNWMRTKYPCLRHTHYVVARENRKSESVLYIGPYGFSSSSAYRLLCDDGVFMTQGFAAFKQQFGSIKLLG